MTLWLPLLNYGRSFAPQVAGVAAAITDRDSCVVGYGLNRAQLAALLHHGQLHMVPTEQLAQCDWVIADASAAPLVSALLPPAQWQEMASVSRPTDRGDRMLVLRRTARKR